ncbi:MAG: hypothetical protein LC620_06485, partial [Halobacteriales archaeon]|nr:hypothetical protein [Halobacteriales archaeon]
RKNRAVALVTEDFRIYHKLVPFLESQGLRVLGLRPGEPVPASVLCLIGGPPEDPRSVPIRADADAVLLSAYCRLDTATGYKRVIFGLDPGKVIGLAVVADGEWLLVAEAMSVPEAVDRIAAWAGGLAARTWEAHVGAGAPEVGRALLASLRARLPNASCSLVPEEDTTPGSSVTGSRHTDAAVHIALRRPTDW